ncbi:MAG: ATP-binding protein [Gemmatimonadota bacterium]|nr:ATP-binding protein [Gemmatimonadota bacterium]
MAHPSGRFVGRSREIGRIRTALDQPHASLIRIEGMRGIGKSALVARALEEGQHVSLRVPALPEPLQVARLRANLVGGDEASMSEGGNEGWPGLFAMALRRARPDGPPFAFVLDDAHRLTEARARYLEPLSAALRSAREERRPFHVVLVGPIARENGELENDELEGDRIVVHPLPLRPATGLLPGRTARDRIRAYSVFGGIPRVLAAVERDVTLETNIRRLALEPDAPFENVAAHWLERDLQTPSRYNAILARLAHGECDWGTLHEAVPDLTSSGQLAPYLGRLEELGLASVRRSLDAAPNSRSRRYVVNDPFLAFCYRFVMHASGTEERLGHIRAALDEHVGTVFPRICRQHMEHDALETLGANARELGSLWSPGPEVPVAGLLASGPAFYGDCWWDQPRQRDDPFGELDRATRETRYGFGREHRLRLLFTGHAAPRWLEREAVRREQCRLIGPEALVGGGRAR